MCHLKLTMTVCRVIRADLSVQSTSNYSFLAKLAPEMTPVNPVGTTEILTAIENTWDGVYVSFDVDYDCLSGDSV